MSNNQLTKTQACVVEWKKIIYTYIAPLFSFSLYLFLVLVSFVLKYVPAGGSRNGTHASIGTNLHYTRKTKKEEHFLFLPL